MDTPITAVWRSNLDAEFKRLKCLTESNPVIAVSTDFPGMVTRPLDALEDYNYQSLRGNLNLVNPVQLSLAPMQRGSNRPVGVWVFNMYFSLGEDVFNQAWVERLVPKVRFEEHSVAGIKLGDLGDRLVTSEILSGPDSLLISYNLPHDLGFIIKAILGTPLPKTEADFITAAKSFVPRYVDLKCVTSSVMHVVPENLLAAAQILRLPSTNEHVTAVTASLYARLVELLGTEPEVNHKIHNLGPLPIRPLSKSLLVPPSPPPFGPPAMPGKRSTFTVLHSVSVPRPLPPPPARPADHSPLARRDAQGNLQGPGVLRVAVGGGRGLTPGSKSPRGRLRESKNRNK